MAYTRRQELMCTEAQMIAKPNVVLRENEVIYIKMNDGTVRQKIGDGSTTIINLPFTQVFDGNVVQTTGESETAVMSQKSTTNVLKDNFNMGMPLHEGEDLDDFTTAGVFYCNTYSMSLTLINAPFQDPFKLEVNSLYGLTRPQQIAYGVEKHEVARRTYNGTKWSEWYHYSSKDDVASVKEAVKDNYKVGVYLKSGTDLDTLTDPGVYYCDSYSVGSTLLNTPTYDAFKMVVNNLYAPTRPQQIIYGSETSKVYRRAMRASGWEAWEQLATYEGMTDKRKIAMFGDSITWGRDGNDAAGTVVRVSNPYPKIVSKQMRITCDNFGVGGSGYLTDGDDGKTAYEKIVSTDIVNYDYITLAFGVNDVLSKPLGEWNSTDETTIMGQMNKTINYIYEQNPNCVVIVIGAWNGRNVGTFPNFKFSDPRMIAMDEAYKTCCEYYGLPYISQKDCPINGFTMDTLMGEDGVHPSALGYERIGYWMAGKLKALIG